MTDDKDDQHSRPGRPAIADTDALDRILAEAVTPARAERRPDVTLHQIRIFWAIAHAETLTKAAKQLGLAQPSLSQQLAKLEQTVGTRLFHRRAGELVLTEAGHYLVARADHLLRAVRELEDGLAQFSSGRRVSIKLAGISSAMRMLVPEVARRLREKLPHAEFDLHEAAPPDILEMLYSREVTVGIMAANSVAQAGVGFVQIPLLEDPHVLITPQSLNLSRVLDPAHDLPETDRRVLESSIEFVFGTQHSKRVEQWWDEALPGRRCIAQCRSFELAVAMVRAGAGVCVAPLLSAVAGDLAGGDVNVYRINATPRQVVALVPTQYRRAEPYATLLGVLEDVARDVALPQVLPVPPFLDRTSLSDL